MDSILIYPSLPGFSILVLKWRNSGGRIGATGEELIYEVFFFSCQYAQCESNLATSFSMQVHM